MFQGFFISAWDWEYKQGSLDGVFAEHWLCSINLCILLGKSSTFHFVTNARKTSFIVDVDHLVGYAFSLFQFVFLRVIGVFFLPHLLNKVAKKYKKQ